MEEALKEAEKVVRQIPSGKVLSYKALGHLIGTGPRQAGQIMHRLGSESVPWWRVVASDGSFPVSKRNPIYENEQRDRLFNEGVPLSESGKVMMRVALWEFDAEIS